jgi:cell division protein FtsB
LTSNSIFSIKSLENKIKENKEILFSIENETQILQNKISLISDIGNIDIDFLDEEARKKLGLKCKDENIIYHLNN